jgi:site-specific recombinase XerD
MATTTPSAGLPDPDGRRLDRHGAGRLVRRVARRAGITKPVGPHTLRHAFITAALDAGSRPGRAATFLGTGGSSMRPT